MVNMLNYFWSKNDKLVKSQIPMAKKKASKSQGAQILSDDFYLAYHEETKDLAQHRIWTSKEVFLRMSHNYLKSIFILIFIRSANVNDLLFAKIPRSGINSFLRSHQKCQKNNVAVINIFQHTRNFGKYNTGNFSKQID